MSASCEKEFSITTSPIEWTITPGAGLAGSGIGGACTGTYDETSLHGPFQFAVHANTNNVRNNFPCLGPCGDPGISASFASNVIGPFAEARNVSVTGTADIENADFVDYKDIGAGCANFPVAVASGLIVRIYDFAIGYVATQTETCSAAESPKAIVVSLNYVLPAGNTFAVDGIINAWGAGKVSSIDIVATATIP